MLFYLIFAISSLLCIQEPLFSIHKQMENKEVEFAVVIPSYNNEKWVWKCLQSVLNQTYENWELYYIDDASEDHTGLLVDFFAYKNKIEDKCHIIHNVERKKSLSNLYHVINEIPPHKVVIDLDGDDWLHDSHVLEKLAEYYKDPKVWMTYGNYRLATHSPHTKSRLCFEFPSEVIKNRECRLYRRFAIIHLRTFYAKLFQQINKQDLLWNGDFFPTNGDIAFMFPMLEMASQGHVLYLKDLLYVYNPNNPISDFRSNKSMQYKLGRYIRKLPPYEPIKELFPKRKA